MGHKLKESQGDGFTPPLSGGAKRLTVPTMWLPVMTMTDLPVPPSANAMYVVRRFSSKRVKTQRYSDWQEEFSTLVMVLLSDPSVAPKKRPRACKPRHPLYVLIVANVDHRRDLDNLVKPILDTMQRVELIPDDRWVEIIEVHRSPLVRKNTFTIIVNEMKKSATDQEMRDVLALENAGKPPVLH